MPARRHRAWLPRQTREPAPRPSQQRDTVILLNKHRCSNTTKDTSGIQGADGEARTPWHRHEMGRPCSVLLPDLARLDSTKSDPVRKGPTQSDPAWPGAAGAGPTRPDPTDPTDPARHEHTHSELGRSLFRAGAGIAGSARLARLGPARLDPVYPVRPDSADAGPTGPTRPIRPDTTPPVPNPADRGRKCGEGKSRTDEAPAATTMRVCVGRSPRRPQRLYPCPAGRYGEGQCRVPNATAQHGLGTTVRCCTRPGCARSACPVYGAARTQGSRRLPNA